MSERLRDWVKRKVKPSSSLAPYTYTPLQTADSIRLIELLPGEDGSPLRCNVVQARRSRNKKHYEALSYAWGKPKFVQRLEEVATSTVLSITESLHEALQCLRHRYTGRWMWVDAVCIAQGDIQEKNHQFRQMAEIYREAESVVIWTGNDDCRNAFNKLHDVGRSCQKAIESGYASSPEDCVEHEGVNINLRRCNFKALEVFFDRPWFSRVWTVQKYVLAKQLQIYARRASMDRLTFRYAVEACNKYIEKSSDIEFSPAIYRTRYLKNFRYLYLRDKSASFAHSQSQDYDQQKGSRLGWLGLKVLDDRQCTNEQDKFSSILGLLPNFSGISPNYALTVFDVRMDITKKVLLAGHLWILDCAETSMDTVIPESFPSFLIRVPDSYNYVQFRPLPISPKDYRHVLKHPVKFGSPVAEDTGPLIIALQGVTIDRIVELVFCNDISGTSELSSDVSLLDKLHFKPNLSNLRDIFRYVSKARLSQNEYTHAECCEVARCFWYTINYGYRSVEYSDGDDINTLLQTFEMNPAISYQRVFFITESGLFGLCSRWTRVGDHMAFFQGPEKPYMLRPVVTEQGEKMWKLIDDCYVDNSMVGHCVDFYCDDTNGEGVKEGSGSQNGPNVIPRKRLFAEQFVLC